MPASASFRPTWTRAKNCLRSIFLPTWRSPLTSSMSSTTALPIARRQAGSAMSSKTTCRRRAPSRRYAPLSPGRATAKPSPMTKTAGSSASTTRPRVWENWADPDLHHDCLRELCRQVIQEGADRWQKALPVRNESRDRGVVGKPGGHYPPQCSRSNVFTTDVTGQCDHAEAGNRRMLEREHVVTQETRR